MDNLWRNLWAPTGPSWTFVTFALSLAIWIVSASIVLATNVLWRKRDFWKTNQRRIHAVEAILLLLIGCAGSSAVYLSWASKINVLPTPPTAPAGRSSLAPIESFLTVRSSISDAAIAAEVEKVVPRSFAIDVRGDARIYGNLSRGPIWVRNNTVAKQVLISTPVGGRIQFEKKIALANVSLGIDVSGAIEGSFSPEVQENWGVNPQLNLNAHLDRALVKTAVGDIDITRQVQDAIGRAVDSAKGTIAGQLMRALDVRKEVNRVWSQMDAVHKLSGSPPTWLRFTPKQVIFRPLHYEPSELDAGLAIVLETHLYIESPPPEGVKVSLPKLETKDKLPEGFALALPVEVPVDVLNHELNKELAQKSIVLSDVGALLTISDATIGPYGDGVLLSVNFTAIKPPWTTVSGRLYITARLAFDRANIQLRADQLAFTTETQDVLVKNAEWLAHSMVLNKIEDAAVLQFPARAFDMALDQANNELTELKKQLPIEVTVDVPVARRIDRIAFVHDKAFAIIAFKGSLSARIAP